MSQAATTAVTRQRTPSNQERDVEKGEGTELRQRTSNPPSSSTSTHSAEGETSGYNSEEDAIFTRSWHRFIRKGKRQIPVGESFKAFATVSILNVCLLVIPVAWAGRFVIEQENEKGENKWPAGLQFALCFISLLPLAKILEFGGEQMGFYTGKDIGDFIAVTLNNAIEATLAIILLLKCELRLLQSTIIGIICLHLLLIPGFAFFTGGARIMEQELHPHVAQLNHTLLTIGVLTLLLPAAFFAAGGNLQAALTPGPGEAGTAGEIAAGTSEVINKTAEAASAAVRAIIREVVGENTTSGTTPEGSLASIPPELKDDLLQMSRGLAILLLLVYICSRIYLHDPPGNEDSLHQHKDAPDELKKEELRLATADPEVNQFVCIGVLIVALGIMAATAEFLVDSIEPLREHIHREWFGLILLPLVSFSADGVVAVVHYIHKLLGRKMPPTTMAKAQAIDLSVQFILFWLPFLILLAWWTNKPLSLLFDLFEVAVVIGACFIVNYVTADAKTNYAEGFAMIAFYLMIAVCAWYYDRQGAVKELLLCPGTEFEEF